MPAIVARHSFRYALGCVAVAVCVAGAAGRWSQHRPPAPPGPQEAAVRQLVLGNAPVERRFAGLFEYFASGFVRHAARGYSRVQFGGAHSFNGYSVDGLEGFARTGSL